MKNNPTAVLFRVDASDKIGTGHFMRCLAIARSIQSRYPNITFLTSPLASSLSDLLDKHGIDHDVTSAPIGTTDDSARTRQISEHLNASFIFIDGYHFGRDYCRAQRRKGAKVIQIDDNGFSDECGANVILNMNAHAIPALYPSSRSNTKLLLGSDFVVLRPEFLSQGRPRSRCSTKNLLITFGGADPDNYTGWLLEWIHKHMPLAFEIKVAAGLSNPRTAELMQYSKSNIEILSNPNMPHLMSWADICIGASGSTVWELAYSGLPSLLFCTADNQELAAKYLREHGVFAFTRRESFERDFKSFLEGAKSREEMGQRASVLVDGTGAERIITALMSESEQSS